MPIKKRRSMLESLVAVSLLVMLVCGVTACSQNRLIGLIYTNIRVPLTKDLHNTPLPENPPPSSRVLEISEPITGAGFYAQVDANAIGAIAKQHGMETLYFADQEMFSILGIWKSNRTILYGE